MFLGAEEGLQAARDPGSNPGRGARPFSKIILPVKDTSYRNVYYVMDTILDFQDNISFHGDIEKNEYRRQWP